MRRAPRAGMQRIGVLCIGTFPPPVHGASVIMAAVTEQIGRIAPVVVVSTASTASGTLYHVNRVVLHARAAIKVAASARLHGAIYCGLPGGVAMIYLIPMFAIARLFRYQIYFHHNSYAYIHRRSLALRVVTGLAPHAVHVTGCEHQASALRALYPSVREHFVCGNAYLAPAIAAQRNTATDRQHKSLVLGHLSNLTVAKGIEVVANIFERLSRAGLDVRLEVAGPTSDEAAQATIERLTQSYPTSFGYVGRVYGDDKWRWLSDIDVFLFPSFYPNETLPVVIDEALAAGAVVLATERGCIRESEGSKALVVFDGADSADVATRMCSWVEHNRHELPRRSEATQLAALRNARATEELTELASRISHGVRP
jgi:glycosyltransferase involved in cell wall biosynthesis